VVRNRPTAWLRGSPVRDVLDARSRQVVRSRTAPTQAAEPVIFRRQAGCQAGQGVVYALRSLPTERDGAGVAIEALHLGPWRVRSCAGLRPKRDPNWTQVVRLMSVSC